MGICGSFTSLAENEWPTNEMQIRGEATGLITGIAIAIPSGMGVCLSVLGGNTSSLVGVAISASLLPPAVNAGVCFVFSFFLAVGAVESTEDKTAEEFAIIGAISFALTALNIFCIWVSGLIMFEIKVGFENAVWIRPACPHPALTDNDCFFRKLLQPRRRVRFGQRISRSQESSIRLLAKTHHPSISPSLNTVSSLRLIRRILLQMSMKRLSLVLNNPLVLNSCLSIVLELEESG